MTSDYQLTSPDAMNGPWGWESRYKLVGLACEFFSMVKIRENHVLIGKTLSNAKKPMPLTIGDFLKYLGVRKAYSKEPNAFRVAETISKMASAGILAFAGRGNRALAGLDDYYLYFAMDVESRRGRFRFVPVLGPEFSLPPVRAGFGPHYWNEWRWGCSCWDWTRCPPLLRPHLRSCRVRYEGGQTAEFSEPRVRGQ